MSKKYAIYRMYYFETTCDDSPSGAYGPSESILVKLTHEEAMEMGEWFEEERPYLIDYDSYMDYVDRVRAKMVREDGYSEEESWEFQVIWNEELIDDCIDYYLSHKDD